SLEEYAQKREVFRADVIRHKKKRRVSIGDHVTLHFEDRQTMQYQMQETLRVEKIFEREAIEEELAAYNPLIPDGSNWKATMMIEYPDIEVRKQQLAKLMGIEDKVWVQVGNFDKVWAIANEDLERTTEEKTSAVHFLRFELNTEMVSSAINKDEIKIGIDHPQYQGVLSLPDLASTSLANDLS
ncbi:MAG: DUF3501 family protein, partial [Gammaproteobacteria bacterium]|nr:DUF3501 family protein [Gammaproteobacteria bacterium]